MLTLSAGAQDYLSPCDIDEFNGDLYITAAEGKSILKVAPATDKNETLLTLPSELTGLTIDPDGILYVTGGGHEGRIWKVSLTGEIIKTWKTGHTPMAPVLSPDQSTLYVCNRFDNEVSFVSLKNGKTFKQIPVLREPVAADITPDGKTLFVANHNPFGPADVDYVASQISAIDTETGEVKQIPLVNGSEGVRDLRMSPDGKYAYATHLMARFLVPTTQLERGWINTDALSVIRVSDQSLLYTILLDDTDQGFPNPWAIGFSEDGSQILVSSAGTHEVSLIDLNAMTEKMDAEVASSDSAAHLNAHNNLSFLSGIRERIQLNGNGPRAIEVVGDTAYVANYFSDTIDRITISTGILEEPIELNPDIELTQIRQGELFFNDASMCFQNWLSCATCHPDARTDALNWDLLNDGMGNPKNAKSLVMAHKTPRSLWLGSYENAGMEVRSGLKHLQFSVRPEEDALAIDAYLASLEPVPSPHLVKGKLSRSAKRGKNVFKTIGCDYCHPAPLFTDLKLHRVGTTKGQDAAKPVDTPTLIESWRSAPYFHDGRSATIRDVMITHEHDQMFKKTATLSPKEIDDLIEYVLSL